MGYPDDRAFVAHHPGWLPGKPVALSRRRGSVCRWLGFAVCWPRDRGQATRVFQELAISPGRHEVVVEENVHGQKFEKERAMTDTLQPEDAASFAVDHRNLMRLAAVRFVVAGFTYALMLLVLRTSKTLGISETLQTQIVDVRYYLATAVSTVLGLGMAWFGFRCCNKVYGVGHAIIAVIFLCAPGFWIPWILAVLIVNGNLSDFLYKHAGSVGFLGVTDEQLKKLEAFKEDGIQPE